MGNSPVNAQLRLPLTASDGSKDAQKKELDAALFLAWRLLPLSRVKPINQITWMSSQGGTRTGMGQLEGELECVVWCVASLQRRQLLRAQVQRPSMMLLFQHAAQQTLQAYLRLVNLFSLL
jgi:hypothetical protein